MGIFRSFMMTFAGVLAGTALATVEGTESTIKQNIAFGNTNSNIEVYLFTDWLCPSCRKLEPAIEKMAPVVMSKSRITFVDFPIHPETKNFTPYNLAFMLKNKDDYLKLRDILSELAAKTAAPTDEQVERAIKPLDVKYQQLNSTDLALGFKYFKQLAYQFGIQATPTMVILNTLTRRGKKLSGSDITEANVLGTIKNLNQR